jgi:hypothetical protein
LGYGSRLYRTRKKHTVLYLKKHRFLGLPTGEVDSFLELTMLMFIDFRFDWENSKIIICMKNCETNKHFYIHERIESEEEAGNIISFWEMHCSTFFDVEFQHPN